MPEENKTEAIITARTIVKSLIPDIESNKDVIASEYIKYYWEQYTSKHSSNRSVNGAVFEELIAITLVRSQIMPFYMQAQITFIPNVDYDFVIYCEEITPIVLSAKVSMRERWKQADLEAVVLKNVHRKSESYLVSMNKAEVNTRKSKLDEVMAINDFVHAASPEYDTLLEKIKANRPCVAPTVPTVTSNNMIRLDNFKARWS